MPRTERVPLYFLFLVPFRWLFGDAVLPALIGQTLVDAGTCVVIARIGAMIDRTTGITAGTLAAAWPNLIIHSSMILSDTLFLFEISLILLFAARFLKRVRFIDIVFVGVMCGLAIMTRTVAMLLPVAMMIAAPFITRYRGVGWQRGITAALIIFVLSTLPAIPLLHRNVTQFDAFELTSQKGTFLLFWGIGIPKSLESGKSFDAVSTELNEKLTARIARLEGPEAQLNGFEVSRHQMALAGEELAAMPLNTLLYGWTYGAVQSLAAPAVALDPRVRGRNKASFYNARGVGVVDRTIAFITGNDRWYVFWLGAGVIGSALTLALQAFGGILLFRRLFWPAVFGSLCILYFLLINGPVGGPKYRLPFEPVLILFQSVAVIEIFRQIRRRMNRVR